MFKVFNNPTPMSGTFSTVATKFTRNGRPKKLYTKPIPVDSILDRYGADCQIAEVANRVVKVTGYDGRGRLIGSASGYLASSNGTEAKVSTAEHIPQQVKRLTTTFLNLATDEQTTLEANLISSDGVADTGILGINLGKSPDLLDLKPIPFSGEYAKPGEIVFTMGYQGNKLTLTPSVVMAIPSRDYEEMFGDSFKPLQFLRQSMNFVDNEEGLWLASASSYGGSGSWVGNIRGETIGTLNRSHAKAIPYARNLISVPLQWLLFKTKYLTRGYAYAAGNKVIQGLIRQAEDTTSYT